MLMLADSGVQAGQMFEAEPTAVDMELHPVRQEIVDEVKRKTQKWKAREIKDNHFRDKTAREVREGTLGSLDQAVPETSPAGHDPFDLLGEKYVRSQSGGLFGSFQALYQQTLGSVSQTLSSGVKKSESDYDNLPFQIEGMDDATRAHARVAESKRPK